MTDEPTATIEFGKKVDKGLLNLYKGKIASAFLNGHSQNRLYIRHDNQRRILLIYGEARKDYLAGILAKYEILGEVVHKDDPKEIKQKEPAIPPKLEARLVNTVQPNLQRGLETKVEKSEPVVEKKTRGSYRPQVQYSKAIPEVISILKIVNDLGSKDILAQLNLNGINIGYFTLVKMLGGMTASGLLGNKHKRYQLK